MFQELTSITGQALLAVWSKFIQYAPLVIVALIVFLVGWFFAVMISSLISQILSGLKFNQLFERGGWKEALEKADLKVNPSSFIGGILKWTLIIVFLMISVEILGSTQLADFLRSILGYLPNVLVAILIFVVTVVIVDIVEKLVRAAVEKSKVEYGSVVSTIIKWSIWVFAILAILDQLGIARSLTQILFTGIVAVLVVSFGLAFGLGGKEMATEMLQDLRRRFRK